MTSCDASRAHDAVNPQNQRDQYGFHKQRFRDTSVHSELRRQSAVWLIAMGVSFDNDKLIDPEDLPL